MMSENALRQALKPAMPEVFPMGSRVVVVDPPADDKGASIFLPPNADVDNLQRGVILRLPEEPQMEPMENVVMHFQDPAISVLRVGDVVYYRSYYRLRDVKVVAVEDIVAYEQTAARQSEPE